jgi:hypothetical protein
MAYVFTLVFLASIVLLIIGLFNPSKAVFWKKSPSTRKQSAAIYTVAIVASLAGIGMTAPDSTDRVNSVKVNEEIVVKALPMK